MHRKGKDQAQKYLIAAAVDCQTVGVIIFKLQTLNPPKTLWGNETPWKIVVPFHGGFRHFLPNNIQQQGEKTNPDSLKELFASVGFLKLIQIKVSISQREVITTVLRGAGIKPKIQSLYLPQSSGQGEHMNKSFKGAL